jgi:hypothetical protein
VRAATDVRRAGPLAVVGVVVNGLGVVVTVALARLLHTRQYGALVQLFGLFLVLQMPGSALLVGVVRRVTGWESAGQGDRTGPWAGRMRRLGGAGVAGAVVVALAVKGTVAHALSQRDSAPVAFIVVAGAAWAVLCLERGLLQSRLAYPALAANLAVEAAVRTVVVVGAVAAGAGVAGATAGVLASVVVAVAHGRLAERRLARARPAPVVAAGTGAPGSGRAVVVSPEAGAAGAGGALAAAAGTSATGADRAPALAAETSAADAGRGPALTVETSAADAGRGAALTAETTAADAGPALAAEVSPSATGPDRASVAAVTAGTSAAGVDLPPVAPPAAGTSTAGPDRAPVVTPAPAAGGAGAGRALAADVTTALVALALLGVLQSLDVILVGRQAPAASGDYAAVSVASKALVFLAIVLSGYLLPEAASRHHRGQRALRPLAASVGLVLVPAAVLVGIGAVAARPFLTVFFGRRLADASAALAPLAVAMTFLAITVLCTHYLLGVGRRRVVAVLLIGAAGTAAAVAGAHGHPVGAARADLAGQAAVALAAITLVARARPVAST